MGVRHDTTAPRSSLWNNDHVNPLYTNASVTGAYEIDLANGDTQDLTLIGNAAFTVTGTTASVANDLRLLVRQDGTGNRTVDWTGMTITWAGGSAPTLQTAADAVDTIGLLSVDNGSTWFGYHAGGGSSVGALDDLSDVTITAAAEADFLRYNGSAWVDSPLQEDDVKSVGHYELLMTGSGPPEPLEDGTGDDWLYVWVNA